MDDHHIDNTVGLVRTVALSSVLGMEDHGSGYLDHERQQEKTERVFGKTYMFMSEPAQEVRGVR